MSCTLCAIVKNEAPFLIEWAAFHRLIGFDRIVVYENDSTDATPELLNALRRAGAIDSVVDWRNASGSPQFSAYRHAALNCADDWMMFLDLDEFLFLKSRQNVNAFLGQFTDDTSCVAVNWRLFGSGGLTQAEPGLTIERFTRASSQTAPVNRHVKSFFRPRCAKAVHMHAPLLHTGRGVLASGAPLHMEVLGIVDRVDWSSAQVNHYFCRSLAEYQAKRARGDSLYRAGDPKKFAKYSEDVFRAHDLNDETDEGLHWILPDVRDFCERMQAEVPA